MKVLLLLFSLGFSAISIAQSENKFICNTVDETETVELGVSHSVVILEDFGSINAGTHKISLKQFIYNNRKSSIFLGEDDLFGYAFYSEYGILGIVNLTNNAYHQFMCQKI